jgi:DnaJ domain
VEASTYFWPHTARVLTGCGSSLPGAKGDASLETVCICVVVLASRAMVEPGSSEEFSVALINAVLLALWPVLPGLLLGYARQALMARNIQPQFALRKSEMLELDRAVRLHERVCGRLASIESKSRRSERLWRRTLHPQPKLDHGDDDEREDLKAHAQHLRETIVRLKRRPLQRLSSWVHLISSKSALGRGAAAYIVGFVSVLVIFHGPEQPAWAEDLAPGAKDAVSWYPFDERLFYVNAAAAGLAAAAVVLFYLARRIGLRREYACEYCTFSDLARSDPSQPIDQRDTGETDREFSRQVNSREREPDGTWFAVLGLPPSANVEDIKAAYKRLIKQNHPDRVHGMSPTFRKLAEAETKRLNAAFHQGLNSRSQACGAAE